MLKTVAVDFEIRTIGMRQLGSAIRINFGKRCCRDNSQTLAAEWGFELSTPVVVAISYLGERPNFESRFIYVIKNDIESVADIMAEPEIENFVKEQEIEATLQNSPHRL
ncbi:hypothetical protein Tco_0174929 [Tanacetum coccineum]